VAGLWVKTASLRTSQLYQQFKSWVGGWRDIGEPFCIEASCRTARAYIFRRPDVRDGAYMSCAHEKLVQS
jgi:hypothetical protein